MTELGTILAVAVGGLISLLGTLLANYLQYLSEKRERKRERLSERLEEVRRYVGAALRLSDLVCDASASGGRRLTDRQYRAWTQHQSLLAEDIKSVSAVGARTILYVSDETLMDLLYEMGPLASRLSRYQDSMDQERTVPQEAWVLRKELIALATKVLERVDYLVDRC